jgi:hypothetical protein
MVASYVHHIVAWMDGTESLPDGEYRAYHVICELIYLNNGPIVMHESGIAGRCNQHVLAFRRNLAKLVERRKLMLGADGKLSNRRAESELKARVKPTSDHPSTPSGPPPDPPPTTAAPPQDGAAKLLKSGKPRPDQNDSALTFSSLSTDSQNPKQKKARAESASKGERLPADWRPKAAHYEQGEKLGIRRDQVDAYADKMRNWAEANAHRAVARKSNWDAAFRNWLADKAERNGGSNGSQRQDGKDRSVSAAADRLVDAGFSFGPRPGGDVPPARENPVRMLPKGGGGRA